MFDMTSVGQGGNVLTTRAPKQWLGSHISGTLNHTPGPLPFAKGCVFITRAAYKIALSKQYEKKKLYTLEILSSEGLHLKRNTLNIPPKNGINM